MGFFEVPSSGSTSSYVWRTLFRPGGVRPPQEVVKAFIDEHRDRFGVEPICRVLQVAPSMYWRHAARQKNPDLRCRREQRDEVLVVHSGLVHTVAGTAANVSDVSQAHALLHGQEEMVLCDAGYRGVQKRPENVDRQVSWHVAMRRSERKVLKGRLGRMKERMEKTKASLRARVEHPFRVIKRQFGYVKVRYRGLAKNTAQLMTLFALGNLWMVRKELMKMTPEVRP